MHTQGKLTYSSENNGRAATITTENGEYLAGLCELTDDTELLKTMQDNAKRLVDCWNFCEGVRNPAEMAPLREMLGSHTDTLCENQKLLHACKKAAEFIKNGVRFGYIKLPVDTPDDPANYTLPVLRNLLIVHDARFLLHDPPNGESPQA